MIYGYYKLIYFLPIALVTGPFLPDLIVVICSLLFLFDSFKLNLFKYYNNNFFKLFLLFFILINLSSLFSKDFTSFKYTVGYIRYGIFAIFLFYVLKNFEEAKFYLGYSIIFVFIILIIDGFTQFIFGKNIFFFELQKYNSELSYVTSFFNDEKKLGSFLSRMFPLLAITFILLIKKFNKFSYNFMFSFIIISTFILIFLSTERVAIFIICIFIFIVFLKSNFLLKPKIIWLISTCLALLLLFYYYPSLWGKMKSVLYSTGILFPGYTNEGKVLGEYEIGKFIYSKYHHDQILGSLNIFLDNPLFGIGAKNFKNTLIGWHPHNYHAQILSETGIFSYLVVFSTFAFLVTQFFKIFFRSLDTKQEINFYLIASFTLTLIPIPSGDFFNNWVNILIFMPVGYYLYFNEK